MSTNATSQKRKASISRKNSRGVKSSETVESEDEEEADEPPKKTRKISETDADAEGASGTSKDKKGKGKARQVDQLDEPMSTPQATPPVPDRHDVYRQALMSALPEERHFQPAGNEMVNVTAIQQLWERFENTPSTPGPMSHLTIEIIKLLRESFRETLREDA
jgi:hypothetical protein